MNFFASIRTRFVADLIGIVLTFIGTAATRLLDRFVPTQHDVSVTTCGVRDVTETKLVTPDGQCGRSYRVFEPCREKIQVPVSKQVLVCD